MSRLTSRAVVLVASLALISLFVALDAGQPAFAGAALAPTRFDDPAPNGCLPNDCSLREAVILANSSPGPDTISLAAGTYNLSMPHEADFVEESGDLVVFSQVSVVGAGATSTAIDGGGNDRVITVGDTANLNLYGVTVRGGQTAANGGGIWNLGTLIVRDSVVANNMANAGAGITSGTSHGRLVVERTTITDNSADLGGGLFLADSGSEATITDTTISNNTATGAYSGGLHIQSGANVTLTNVTVSDNSSQAVSGITVTSGNTHASLINVTIANNVSPPGIGSAVANYANLTLTNTIIQDAVRSCGGDGAFQSDGHNIDDDGTCQLNAASDQPSSNAMLGPLSDNGGPTLTLALIAGSPAINAGDEDACPFTDQRGYGRVDACDIGAFELGGAPAQIKQGDVDCDGDVDAVDALKILQAVAGLGDSPCLGFAADVDCDGDVDAVDALAILRFIAALPPSPQLEPCADIGTPLQAIGKLLVVVH